jgi:hypothetical protein
MPQSIAVVQLGDGPKELATTISYSSNRRDALDASLPIGHRASHARSCAVLVAEKYRVKRSAVIDLVKERCGVDLTAVVSDEEIAHAVEILDDLKARGIQSEYNTAGGEMAG